jgi:hypothetical protein
VQTMRAHHGVLVVRANGGQNIDEGAVPEYHARARVIQDDVDSPGECSC